MLSKVVKKEGGREPTLLPGPGVPAAGVQAAWGGGVCSTLPPLPLPANPSLPPPPTILGEDFVEILLTMLRKTLS